MSRVRIETVLYVEPSYEGDIFQYIYILSVQSTLIFKYSLMQHSDRTHSTSHIQPFKFKEKNNVVIFLLLEDEVESM
jgi:hypothetical protein